MEQTKAPQVVTKKAQITLYTRYGYSHLGIDKSKREVYIPTLSLFSTRASQLFKVAHNDTNKNLARVAWAILEDTRDKMRQCRIELQQANDAAQQLLDQHHQLAENVSSTKHKNTYEVICNSKLTEKAIQLIVLYDNTVLKYLYLWDHELIERTECFRQIKKCSRALRKLFSDFSVEVKKLLPTKVKKANLAMELVSKILKKIGLKA